MDGASRWTSDRIFYCFGGASRDGCLWDGWARMEAGRDWRAVYRRIRSCVTTSNLECKNSQKKTMCACLSFSLERPSLVSQLSSLVTPTAPVVCYSRDRTPPATRINRGPLWRPMFSCSQEGAAAYRGLSSTKLGPVMARPGRRPAGGAMPESCASGTRWPPGLMDQRCIYWEGVHE